MRDPIKVLKAENEALRDENQKLRQRIAAVATQANGDIDKVAAECQALKNFLGAIILQHGGELLVKEETFQEASTTPYRFHTKPGPDGTGTMWRLEKGQASAPSPILLPVDARSRGPLRLH